jgi:hypothetical protein
MSRFDGEATALASNNENDSEIILCDLRTEVELKTFRTVQCHRK